MRRLKGVYILTEKDCLRANSGSYLHTKNGYLGLARHFSMQFLAPSHVPVKFVDNVLQPLPQTKGGPQGPVETRKNPVLGVLRDLKTFWFGHKEIIRFYKFLRKEKPDFIYERVAYFNFMGYICARLLGIKYYTEVNGAFHNDVKKFYYSWLNPIARRLMAYTYQHSDVSFAVGGMKQVLKLKGEHVISVQNGIESQLLDQVEDYQKPYDGKLHICMIAFLAKHHRVENLIEAMKHLDHPERVHLHLIGKNFEPVLDKFTEVETTFHGIIPHNELVDYAKDYHVGIIPGSGPGDSHMKLYMYGVLKLLAIVPEQPNFKLHFNDTHVIYFDQEQARQISDCINQIINDPDLIYSYGNRLQQKVRKEHTWKSIFDFSAAKMMENMGMIDESASKDASSLTKENAGMLELDK